MNNNTRRYKLSRLFEISHSIDGDLTKAHDHTLCISMVITTNGDIDFREAEGIIIKELSIYDRKYLNDMDRFKRNATVERLGEAICYSLDKSFKDLGYDMIRFEIGETPLRVYVITDELRD